MHADRKCREEENHMATNTQQLFINHVATLSDRGQDTMRGRDQIDTDVLLQYESESQVH